MSVDGGVTFSPTNLQLEPGQSDVLPVENGDYGSPFDYCDYTGLAFFGGYIYACWADNSNTTGGNPDLDLYGAVYGFDIYVAKMRP